MAECMNRDEGSYQLSHAYDRFLDATADRRIKTRKNWVPASSDEDLVMRSKRQNKVEMFGCDWWIFNCMISQLFVWNREDYTSCVILFYKCGYYQSDTLLILAVQEYKKKTVCQKSWKLVNLVGCS